jgi:hypothetical protein
MATRLVRSKRVWARLGVDMLVTVSQVVVVGRSRE